MTKSLLKFMLAGFIILISFKNSYATLTATVNTTDVNTGALYQGELANVLFGANVTSTTATTFTSFTLSSSQTISNYFGNFKVYVSTTGSYLGATLITGTPAFTTLTATTLTVTLPAATTLTANTTYSYYLVADFTGSGTLPATFLFSATGFKSAANTITTSFPYNTYQLNNFKTYYWTGNGNNNAWRTLTNWSFSNQTTGAAATSYPGQLVATDVVTTAPSLTTAAITLSNALPNNLAQIYIPSNTTVTLSINTPTLTTGILYLDEDAAGDIAYLTVNGSGGLVVNGTTTLMYNAEIQVKGTVTFGPTVNFADTYGEIYNNGGTITANNTTFAMTTDDAYIYNTGTFNATSCTFTMSGYFAEIYNTGTFTSNTNGTFTLSGQYAEIYNNSSTGLFTTNTAATFTLSGAYSEIYNSSSAIFTTNTNATYTLSGNTSLVQNANGTFNVNNAGTFTLNGANSEVNNSNGTFNAYATTFSLTGNSSELLVSGGNFYAYAGGSYTLNTATAGTNAIILVNSNGFFTATSCTFNLNGTKNLFNTNVKGSTTINSSTITLAGTSTYFNNSGILNLLGCTVNATGAYNSNYYFGIINHTKGTLNIGSSLATDATTINLGTSVAATANGPSSQVYSDGGAVNIGTGSIINCFAPNTNINNTYATAGTYSTFTCNPLSIINLYSTTSNINNDCPNTYFTLLSDATGSTTIGTLPAGASITGTYNVQRYLTGGDNTYRNYRLLSSPVNKKQAAPGSANNIDLSYLGASATIPANYYGAFISGPGSGFGVTPLHQTTNPIIYLYQESITPGTSYNKAFTSGKNVGINAINTSSPYNVTTVSTATGGISASAVAIPAGNAYLLYYIGDNQRATTSSTTLPVAATLTASGYINQGTVKVYMWGTTPTSALTYTTGTNARNPGLTMIGNPYPSTIDLHQFYLDNSSALSGTFYELSDVTQQFPTYNGASNLVSGSPAGGSQYVASGQGFYIQLAAAGTVSFKEGQKTPSATSAVFPSPSLLSLAPSSPGITKNTVNSIIVNHSTNDVSTITASPKIALRTEGKNRNNKAPASDKPTVQPDDTRPTPQIIRVAPADAVSATAKTTDDIIVAAAKFQQPAGVHLKLIKDSVNYDECAIFFSNAWTDTFDKYDSFDLDGLGPKVYLSSYTSDNVRTSINALGNYIKGKRVKLQVKVVADGTYTLQLEDMQNINTNKYNVYLVDHKLADSLDIVKNVSYKTTITAADTTSFSNRFELVVHHKPVPPYKLLYFFGQKISAGVKLNWKTINEGDYTGFVLQKKIGNNYVSIDSLQSDSASSYTAVDPHPTLGNNIYRLAQNDINGNITYTASITIGYNSTSSSADLTIYPNPAKSIITVTYGSSLSTLPNCIVNIYNTSGTLIGKKTVTTTSFTEDVSSYKLGVYILELKDGNGNLLGKSKFVKIN